MDYPAEWETDYTTKNGLKVVLRPELSRDLELLWILFSTMSKESISCLLPPIPRDVVETWVDNIDYDLVLPIVALVTDNGKQKIIASGILRLNEHIPLRHKAELGVAVHDDYQNVGIGTAMVTHLLSIARNKGLTKVYLHVSTANERAIHVYEKAGFKKEGTLRNESCVNGKYRDEYRMALLF
ncbi:MAG: GNAT family protein [Candidatus Bathyarchaeia archaeon]|jgi:putative acetyltransferase